jgi:hypothetical protein
VLVSGWGGIEKALKWEGEAYVAPRKGCWGQVGTLSLTTDGLEHQAEIFL